MALYKKYIFIFISPIIGKCFMIIIVIINIIIF